MRTSEAGGSLPLAFPAQARSAPGFIGPGLVPEPRPGVRPEAMLRPVTVAPCARAILGPKHGGWWEWIRNFGSAWLRFEHG
jgi:hypothetical protein